MMITFAEEVKDPVHNDWKERIKSGDDTEPPRYDKTAARAFRHTHHAAGNIFGFEAGVA
jgi:hypothetical protein